MGFQIIGEARWCICVNHFTAVKQFYFLFFPTLCSNAEGFYACLTNCVGAFRETGSVTHKKGAGRPIVRIEEMITRNKLGKNE
jgi:hypothetical protein